MQGFTVQTVEGFGVQDAQVILGSNPEDADYDNPRGYIYGFAFRIVASNQHGDTRYLDFKVAPNRHHYSTVQAEAEALAAALNARLARGLLPVAFATWREGRAVYGSDAYVEYGQDEDNELERMEARDEADGLRF